MNKVISVVPDLIYDDYRNRRIAEIIAYYTNPGCLLPPKWNRITLFTTYHCNLNCVYCKTIRKNKNYKLPGEYRQLNLAEFKSLLDMFAGIPVQHIHFTGGEASLVPDLPEMIRAAGEKGILCSTTTNGMAGKETYRKLIAAGINEIRISLDSHDPEEFDRIAGKRGTYYQVMDAIKYMIQLRERLQKELFIIINSCIGYHNRQQLPDFIGRTLELGVDDIKLITIVQTRNDLGDFKEKNTILEQIRQQLIPFPAAGFPLLRYKLKTVFANQEIGLKELTARQLMHNCFIPLTERTLDATHYYPCSIYLREGGKPLGRIDQDNLQIQQQKIIRFVKENNCLEDPVCSEYCISCCKKFNLFANWKIYKSFIGKDKQDVPIAFSVKLEKDIPDHEISYYLQECREKQTRALHQVQENAEAFPFLVIKPEGINFKQDIYALIHTGKLAIQREISIPHWNLMALCLYCNPPDEYRIKRGLIIHYACRQIYAQDNALLVILEKDTGFTALKNLKNLVRGRLATKYYLIEHFEQLVISSFTYIHTPEEAKSALEYLLLLGDGGCQAVARISTDL